MRNPLPGRDYPRTQQDFYSQFSDREACLEWLEHLRWGSTRGARRCSNLTSNKIISGSSFICPECGCPDAIIVDHGRRCRGCRHRVSVLAGTPFYHTRVSLTHLLEAAWIITDPGSTLNAMGYMNLARVTHENSWALLHKYREVMRDEMMALELHGLVEADECFIGGKPRKTWQFLPGADALAAAPPRSARATLSGDAQGSRRRNLHRPGGNVRLRGRFPGDSNSPIGDLDALQRQWPGGGQPLGGWDGRRREPRLRGRLHGGAISGQHIHRQPLLEAERQLPLGQR